MVGEGYTQPQIHGAERMCRIRDPRKKVNPSVRYLPDQERSPANLVEIFTRFATLY